MAERISLEHHAFKATKLTCGAHRLLARTIRVPAIAGDGEFFARALAVRAAILAALHHRAFTTRMRTFVEFLFAHDGPLAFCLLAQQETTHNGAGWYVALAVNSFANGCELKPRAWAGACISHRCWVSLLGIAAGYRLAFPV